MSDAFAQLNALLAAAAAQQQRQQQQQQQQQPQQQSQQHHFQTSNQQQLFQQQFTNQQRTSPFNNPSLGPLTEQALQSLLTQKQLGNKAATVGAVGSASQNFSQAPQQSYLNSINSDMNYKSNFEYNSMPPMSMSRNDNDQFRGDSYFRSNDSFNPRQQPHQSYQQMDEPQTRKLEPYFSDDSPLNSLEHQLSMANMHRENSANQLDMLNEFQKISLNDSKANTSSNFDQSTSFNDSEIYSADQNYMPGTASLIEDVDKQIMVVLRDGRTLIGYLRSIDQYANLLLSSCFERIHVGNKYSDIPKGIYIIRGENVVLIGEVDFKLPLKVEMCRVEAEEILELQRIEHKHEETEKNKKKALMERCLISQTDAVLDEYY